MLRHLVSKIWKALTPSIRLRLVRATQRKFTVSVAAVVTNDENKVLLLKHVLRPHSDWGIPGGFIEAGEQPEAAIRRELMEETGLELDDVSMLRVRTINRHIEILFTARASGEAKVSSREITELGWYAPGEMPEGTSNVQKHMVDEIINRDV